MSRKQDRSGTWRFGEVCRTRMLKSLCLGGSAFLIAACSTISSQANSDSQQPEQARISSRGIPVIEVDGLRFRDLNRNDTLDAYEDWRRPAAERAEDLLAMMTLEEKAGQLVIPGLNPNAPFGQTATGHDLDALRDFVAEKHISHVNIRLGADARTLALSNNAAQEVAESGRLGIPLTISTDSRHGFTELVGASFASGAFSSWPNSLGFAALQDADVVRAQAALVARDLRASGFAMLLGPQIDLASEPRWPRIYETYGENPELSAKLAAAFVEGVQGSTDGAGKGGVAAVIKHFAGYSAAVDGLDAHNRYGRFSQVDADEFRLHTMPFEGAFRSRPAGVMPAYSILRGLEIDGEPVEQVGTAFSSAIIGSVLRRQLGFEGVVVTDWAVIEDCGDICMNGFPEGQYPTFQGISTAWGVENLTKAQRVAKALNAGVDQFGGLEQTEPLLKAVRSGLVTQARVDQSVQRVLEMNFKLGLYEDPFVDADRAEAIVSGEVDAAAGRLVQSRSMVVLESDRKIAIEPGAKVALFGVDAELAGEAGFTPVTDPAEAQFAIVRTSSPFERLHPNYMFGSIQQEGSLAFPEDHPALAFIERLPAELPLIVDVRLDRPAILTPFKDRANILLASFGTGDTAFFDVLQGRVAPVGRLPFQLPSSMDSVRAQRPGTPMDLDEPLYEFGYSATVGN